MSVLFRLAIIPPQILLFCIPVLLFYANLLCQCSLPADFFCLMVGVLVLALSLNRCYGRIVWPVAYLYFQKKIFLTLLGSYGAIWIICCLGIGLNYLVGSTTNTIVIFDSQRHVSWISFLGGLVHLILCYIFNILIFSIKQFFFTR